MDNQYTSLDLLPIIYRELSPEELGPIFSVLQIDEKLKREFLRMKAAKQSLPQLQLEPTDATISNILAYSRARVS